MANIRIIVEDNDRPLLDKSYPLPGEMNHLDEIDEAVEEFKNQVLPQIEKELFAQAQEQNVSEVKKTVTDP